MNTFEFALAYLMPPAIGMLMLFLPALSRGSTFFAVTVPTDFPQSEIGQAIVRRYRIGTLAAILLSLAIITPLWWWIDSPHDLVVMNLVGTLGVVFGAMAAFIHCRGCALRYSQDNPNRRSATLAPPPRLTDIVPRPLWLHGVPYLILAFAAGWLVAHWRQIPDPLLLPGDASTRMAVFEKATVTIFALPLLMFGTIMLIHSVMALGLLVRRLPGHQPRVQSINRMLLWMMMVISVLGAWNSLAVLYGPHWITGPAGVTINLAATLLILAIPVWMALSGRLARPGQAAEGDHSPDRCWKFGLVYFNPDDPALWVEMRFGVGYTVNFARPLAWVLFGGILGLTLLVVLVSLP